MAYEPAGSAGSTNSPRSSDTVSLSRLVPSWVTVTFTPGRTAPLLSRTTPYSVAVVTCPRACPTGSESVARSTRSLSGIDPLLWALSQPRWTQHDRGIWQRTRHDEMFCG